MQSSNIEIAKYPLRKVELAVSKFNDIVIPHHVDLLKKHKTNISEFQESGDFDKIYKEQVNATRSVKQLKAQLSELDQLRSQVRDSDVKKFDEITLKAKQNALDAIREYLDFNPEIFSPVSESPKYPPNHSFDDVETTLKKIQISLSEEDLIKQRNCLKSLENLRAEVEDVHELFQDLSKIVDDQKEPIDKISDNVEIASENITGGERILRQAVKYKAASYPIAGALIGTCIGGPIGLFLGIKAGSLAAVGCGILGFTGGKFFKGKQNSLADESQNYIPKSSSMPDMKTDENFIKNEQRKSSVI